MKVYRTTNGLLVEDNGAFHALSGSIDDLLSGDTFGMLKAAAAAPSVNTRGAETLLAPVGTQEVWASGVTYYRSRNARMEESKDAGGGTFYDRVYEAERPELFFKATANRVVAPGKPVRIRRDATWSVPEPELTLVLHSNGNIVGYTIGNDMSSRDIEGENPLYLPQAKVYNGSCALGPCILFTEEPVAKTTSIHIAIERSGKTEFEGSTTLAELKRDPKELAGYLYRELDFDTGAFLLTGTGIVPGDAFTLQSNDVITITIEGIGTLTNPVL